MLLRAPFSVRLTSTYTSPLFTRGPVYVSILSPILPPGRGYVRVLFIVYIWAVFSNKELLYRSDQPGRNLSSLQPKLN